MDKVKVVSGEEALIKEMVNSLRKVKREFNVVVGIKESKLALTSPALLNLFNDVTANQKIKGRIILPDTFVDGPTLKEIIEILRQRGNKNELNSVNKLFKRFINSKNVEMRFLEVDAIYVGFSVNDGKYGCIGLYSPYPGESMVKLIFEDKNIARVMKKHFLYLWKLARKMKLDYISKV